MRGLLFSRSAEDSNRWFPAAMYEIVERALWIKDVGLISCLAGYQCRNGPGTGFRDSLRLRRKV